MPYFSESSKTKLGTCHPDLQKVLEIVIDYFDCKVIYGHRTPEEQFRLFQKGRQSSTTHELVIVNKSKVVTYKDGYNKLSKHNHSPSMAVDVLPYPIDWKDTNRMRYFAGYMMATFQELLSRGYLSGDYKLRWGGDWDGDSQLKDNNFNDLGHFELIL